jgi:hypothetical protein
MVEDNWEINALSLSPTLEFRYVLNARQPIMEKFSPYFVIGMGPL